MQVIASTPHSQAHSEKSEILESDEISATTEEELAYRSDNSDASWMGDFTEDNAKEQLCKAI
jgi:hypothetical protein